MELFETPLPGIGTRYEFQSQHGDRVAIVVRRDGQRDIAMYDREDPDTCKALVELTEAETARVAELMGGTTITERLEKVRHDVEGLAMEWVDIPKGAKIAKKSIAQGKIRTKTSASVVAVMRGAEHFPGPEGDFVFAVGDNVLVIGTADAVKQAATYLSA